MKIEDELKELIVNKYGSVFNFSADVGIPNSTLSNTLKNGLEKTSLTNAIKICDALSISVDALAVGKIIPIDKSKKTLHLEDVLIDLKLKFENSNVTLKGMPVVEEEKQRLLFLFEAGIDMIRREK